MTPGLGFALGAMACFGVSDLIYKRGAAAGIQSGEFLMAAGLDVLSRRDALCLAHAAMLDVHLAAVLGRARRRCFCSSRCYNFTQSLHGGAVSTNAPIFRLNFTLTAALAIIVLGEALTIAKAVALGCALVAVWLLLAEAGVERGKVNFASLAQVLLAAVTMALTNLFYKIGLLHGTLPETMVAAQAWTFCSLATLVRLLAPRRRLDSAARLELRGARRAGPVRRIRAADARTRARSSQRAGAGGSNELRHHRARRHRTISRAPGFAQKPWPCGSPRGAGVVRSGLNRSPLRSRRERLHPAVLDRLRRGRGREKRNQPSGIFMRLRAGHDGGGEHLHELDLRR